MAALTLIRYGGQEFHRRRNPPCRVQHSQLDDCADKYLPKLGYTNTQLLMVLRVVVLVEPTNNLREFEIQVWNVRSVLIQLVVIVVSFLESVVLENVVIDVMEGKVL